MQYTKEMADKVMRGEKTQTRRRGKPRHKKGSRQPVQNGYRQKALGYVIIDEVRTQCVCDITAKEVKAEGFNDYNTFLNYLKKLSPGVVFHAYLELTVYEFHLEEPDATTENIK